MPATAATPDDTARDGIVATNVSRAFGPVRALRDASLRVEPGSVTALIGPNGAGKTTLLLILASLLVPDTGRVLVGGRDAVSEPAAVRARMGWMPDVLGSWASLTVRTTLETAGRMYRLDPRTAAQRAKELLRLVDLQALADQPTRVLSRGQKQRLSLARALVHHPSVLLLDEPASGLDPVARADLRALIRRLAGDGVAVLVSSHVLAELEEMADAAVYLSAGVTASAERIAAAASGLRQWRITALDAPGLAEALAVAGVPGDRVEPDRSGLLVALDGEREAAALLRRLVTDGVAVTSFAPAVGELEHTFLDLARPDPEARR